MSDDRLDRVEKRSRRLALAVWVLSVPLFFILGVASSVFFQSRPFYGPYQMECVVSRTDLPADHVLSVEDLAIRMISYTNGYPQNIINKQDAALLIGHRLHSPVKAGESITKATLNIAGEWPPPFE